jgi:selenocysteine lyase/cysteine desulfurase
MGMTRRDVLAAFSSIPAAGAVSSLASSIEIPQVLPDKASFAETDLAYLNSGSSHPLLRSARGAMESYIARRSLDDDAAGHQRGEPGPIEKFARLVNADPDEIAFVQSTTAGEQMVLQALGIPESGGRIVTDTLHFFGSMPLYLEMERRGMEVTWLRASDGRIRLEDMKRAVRKGTKLVSLSLVSTINGFQHDLEAVCDIAHANGALVYADIIHAAGCIPVDLHASGVDFAACASYKWLMGDFGLGFIYARKDLQPKLKRINYGYHGISKFEPHVYPFDPAGTSIADYAFEESATGLFALGTRASIVAAALDESLDYILGVGVNRIQAHAQTLAGILKQELPRLGYPLMTPPEAKTPLVTCVYADARRKLSTPLQEAGVRISTSTNRFRASLSVFNDETDVERLLKALPRA